MYKKRIKQWGLKKTNRENEMRAIVRKNKQRLDQGKRTIFRVRGRLVNLQDSARYWDRKRVSMSDDRIHARLSVTPEAVQLFTPSPSPIASPKVFANPERIFTTLRNYYHGSFESGTWVAVNEKSPCYSTKNNSNDAEKDLNRRDYTFVALDLFEKDRYREAGQALIAATAGIRRILFSEHPLTLMYLFSVLSVIHHRRKPEINSAILRQCCAMGECVLRKEHPLTRIPEWLTSVEPSSFIEVVLRCSQGICDHFDALLGPLHLSALRARAEYIFAMEAHSEHRHGNQIQMEMLVSKCETSLGLHDFRTVHVRDNLAHLYMYKQDYVLALEEAQNVLDDSRHLPEPRQREESCAGAIHVIAHSQYAFGKTSSAEANLRRAIDLRLSNFGQNDTRAAGWLLELEGWLEEQGQIDAAAEVQKRRQEALLEVMD